MISNVLTAILILYAGLAAPALSRPVANLFDYSVVKISIVSLIVFLVKKQMNVLALLIAIGFVISLNTLNTHLALEEMGSLTPIGAMDDDTPYEKVTPGPVSTVTWSSNHEEVNLQLRGERYTHKNVKNLLPGGHDD
jgi:hypothetical protein